MTRSPEQKKPEPEDLNNLYAREEDEDKRSLRFSLTVAFAIHLVFLFSAIPTFQASEAEPAPKPKVLKLTKTPRFRQPPPPPKEKPKPREMVRNVPVPDLDPDNDPYVVDLGPEVEIPVDTEAFLVVPDPPPPPPEPVITEPVRVGGRISAPVRTVYVQPRYPGPAKRARIQGKVVLEATIDVNGHVVDLKLVSGQPFGLSDAALDAVSQWRFEPSRLGDKVVPVLYRVEVDFTLR